jgi:hypothetical protein
MHECNTKASQRELAFLRQVKLVRLVDRHEAKAKAVTWLELRNERKVDARHFAQARISAGGLMVGHQDDRFATRRKLYRPEGDAFGKQLDGLAQREGHTGESITHAIRVRRNSKRPSAESIARFIVEQIVVRAGDQAHHRVVGISWTQGSGYAPPSRHGGGTGFAQRGGDPRRPL